MKFTPTRTERISVFRSAVRCMLGVFTLLLFLTTSGQAQTPAPNQKTITLQELQRMALKNNPTLAQAIANIRAAEGRKQQSGLYPNPTVGYQGEEIRGGSFRGGEQGFFVQQNIVTA